MKEEIDIMIINYLNVAYLLGYKTMRLLANNICISDNGKMIHASIIVSIFYKMMMSQVLCYIVACQQYHVVSNLQQFSKMLSPHFHQS